MQRTGALALVSIAELLAMGLWFGVSAVAPQIASEWQLDPATTAWLTLAVQLGFVAGTLLSATLNLPDVIGALTLGKASPYLINVLGSNWRMNVGVLSILALLSSLIVLRFVGEGPYALPNQPFDITQITRVFSNRGVRLANFGYFGHMWELYAMWTWAPVMIRASVAASGDSPKLAEAASFAVIGAGAIGCVVAGLVADRIGRAVVAASAMAASGACCLVIGFLYGKAPVALLAVAIIWGATVVADSAQFSACVT